MLDLAEKADFWSLLAVYRPSPLPEDKLFPGQNEIEAEVYLRVEITTNRMVKDLRIYDAGGRSDVPQAADELIYKLANLAKRDLWRGFTRETTAQLKQNGFDFHSKRGGEFLIEMTVSPGNSDADIDSLLDLGAPADYVNTGHFLLETGLLDAAIDSGRSAFVDKLIFNGALLTAGEPDPAKTSRALAHAAAEASPEMVARFLSLHPPLVFRTKNVSGDATEWNIPVITLVGQNKEPLGRDEVPDIGGQVAVTQQLLDAGADINDRGTMQWSLLDKAVHQGNLSFVSWLIAHHAQVTNESFVPMLSDEMTVLLLKTDPQLDDATWDQIKSNAEPKTKAWLKANDG